jgi:protein TonB
MFPTTSRSRLGRALLASVLLHVGLLLPAHWLLPRPPARPVPLDVALPPPDRAQALTTQPEPAPEPVTAVPRTQNLSPPEPPRVLRGRALDTAMAALTREEFYPRAAIERGIEGRVVLLLHLDENGRVTALSVASGSGHALLDEAALRAAGRIGHIPGSRAQVLLPVEFRLE